MLDSLKLNGYGSIVFFLFSLMIVLVALGVFAYLVFADQLEVSRYGLTFFIG